MIVFLQSRPIFPDKILKRWGRAFICQSALTLEVSFQERDDSYPKLSKSRLYLNNLPILGDLWYSSPICDLNTLYPISHTARSLHLISIISPNSQNISLGRSPPSSSLREEVKETCKFGRDHLSWFLSWPSWKSPRLDPEHYFGLLEKIFATNISFHPRESWCTTLNIWELWWHLGEKVYINPAAPLFPLQLRWTHRLRWGITFFMLINIALRR